MRKDAELRRQRILEAACELMTERGQSISLEQVAKKAEVGIATLYRHFPTRNTLLHECILRLCDNVINGIDQAIEQIAAGNMGQEKAFHELIMRAVPVGINVYIPALVDQDESLLGEELLAMKARFSEKIMQVMNLARQFGFIHESVSNNAVLSGLIGLYSAPIFNFTQTAKRDQQMESLISIFLEGCEKGVNDAYTVIHNDVEEIGFN